MSQKGVEQVLGRMVTDVWFRFLAAESLEMASIKEGYVLTSAELLRLADLEPELLRELAASLDTGLCRA